MRLPVALLAVTAAAAPNQQPLLESSPSLLTSPSSSTPSSSFSTPPSLLSPSPVDPAIFTSLERFARIVDIAYCVGTTGSGISKPFSCLSRCRDFPELRLVTTFNTGVLLGDTCGYVAVDNVHNEVLVAFRGTYSLTNTIEDLRTIPQEYIPYEPGIPDDGSQRPSCLNCTVHTGFYDSWQSARPLVLPAVMSARNISSTSPPLRVRLVGHSLGGAVAALAGLEMRAILGWGDDVQVTTFGEPRIGNEGLADFVETVFGLDEDSGLTDAFHRVTHRNDPVPLLPLTEWGFHAHSGEIFIDKVDLPPAPADVVRCHGRDDPACLAGPSSSRRGGKTTPFSRLRPWELFFAHRDYFWRIGLCVPGGDPADWWRWGQYGNESA